MLGSSLSRPDRFLVKHLERHLTRLPKVIAKTSRDDILIADRAGPDLPGLILEAVPPVMVAIRDIVKGFASPERTFLQFRVVTALLRGPSTITELAALTGASAAAVSKVIAAMAALGLIAAERHRRATGEGQLVEIALKDTALAMLGHLGIIGEVMVNREDRAKHGNSLFGAYGQDFVTADGRRVMVVGLTRRQWAGLLAATGLAQPIEELGRRLGLKLGLEGERFKARKEITAILEPWFRARRVEDFARSFDEHGVTWSEFRSFARAVAEDPDLSTRNPMFELLDQPGVGRYLAPGTPLAFSAFAREPPRPAPTLGEHTEEILAEVVGLGPAEIASLYDDRIVAGPRR